MCQLQWSTQMFNVSRLVNSKSPMSMSSRVDLKRQRNILPHSGQLSHRPATRHIERSTNYVQRRSDVLDCSAVQTACAYLPPRGGRSVRCIGAAEMSYLQRHKTPPCLMSHIWCVQFTTAHLMAYDHVCAQRCLCTVRVQCTGVKYHVAYYFVQSTEYTDMCIVTPRTNSLASCEQRTENKEEKQRSKCSKCSLTKDRRFVPQPYVYTKAPDRWQ